MIRDQLEVISVMGGPRTVEVERGTCVWTAYIDGEPVLCKFKGRPVTALSDNLAMIADAARALCEQV